MNFLAPSCRSWKVYKWPDTGPWRSHTEGRSWGRDQASLNQVWWERNMIFVTCKNLMILQTASPPQKAGSVRVQTSSGIRVNMAVRMSANDKCTRKKFIHESWNELSFLFPSLIGLFKKNLHRNLKLFSIS